MTGHEPGVCDIGEADTVRRVPVGASHFALVDAIDYPLVAPFKWRLLHGYGDKLYAYVRGSVYMHRIIAETTPGQETDHVNGDGLDNRRYNLRVCTSSQNRVNTWKPRRPDGSAHTSTFKGVSWEKSRGRWQAKIQHDGRYRNLGRYDSEVAAARAYDVAALARWGEFAQLNFPEAVT